MKEFIENYLEEVSEIAKNISKTEIENVANEIIKTRDNNGRIFL